MGYKKPTTVSRTYLENAMLPQHDPSYTVISHKFIIENTKDLLQLHGFRVVKETYRANQNANVAQGIYVIEPVNVMTPAFTPNPNITKDNELAMTFAWTNSYDKSIRFQCAIGASVTVCSNGMMCGEMKFARKHTGAADADILAQITEQIKAADNTYKTIVQDKENLKGVSISLRTQAELIGRLYYELNLLEANQLTIIKQEMKSPSFNYNVDSNSAWAFYNHVTHALKKSHPRVWMKSSHRFHEFMTQEFLSNTPSTMNDTVKVSENTWNMDFEEAAINVDDLLDSLG